MFNAAQINTSEFCVEAMFSYWDGVRLDKDDKALAELQQTLAVDNEEGLFAEVHWQHVYQGKTLEVADVVQ